MNEFLKNAALKIIAKKETSSQEFQEKMIRKFPDKKREIDEILAVFKQENWINDERYSEYFIEYQMLTTKSGPFLITQKLKHKGFPQSLAQEKIQEIFPYEKQIELASQLIEKKQRALNLSKKEISDYERQQKIIQYLVGKGYSFEVAQKAVEKK